MAPERDQNTFLPLRQILVNVSAGLILSALAGIGYMVYVVPRLLDQVLSNQRFYGDQLTRIDQRVTGLEGDVKGLSTRTTRLEAGR